MKPGTLLAPGVLGLVTARLNAAIGIDPGALDPARMRWVLRARCRHLALDGDEAYAALLESDPAEIDALIDEVVVQETRFFRDPVVFDHIRAAAAQLGATHPGPLRALSAPCGTGQEAYSLAATLQLAGVPLARFSVDAVDISLSALEIAARGLYAERALSHVAPELRQTCGSSAGRHFEIHDSLRERVQFSRRNLAQPGVLQDLQGQDAQYHLILCRNLFIYLAPAARAALAESLASALLPGGRLFLGTADRVEELSPYFAPLRPAASFAFVHRDTARADRTLTRRPRQAVGIVAPPAATPAPRRQPPAPDAPAAPSGSPASAGELLTRALEHRQRGELVRAERRCRQALYLDPNLLPALELLQSLWSENPNLRLRRALRDRILRHRLLRPPAPDAERGGLKESA
jgi:chemotaxis protein methyltransferase WspC